MPPNTQIHKILAGLLDQHALAGQDGALKIAAGMAEYHCGRWVNGLSLAVFGGGQEQPCLAVGHTPTACILSFTAPCPSP